MHETLIDTAGWFWSIKRLIAIVDDDDTAEIIRKIRGDKPSVGVTLPWPSSAHYPNGVANITRIAKLLGDMY